MSTRRKFQTVGFFLLGWSLVFSTSCSREEGFTQQGNAQTFVQDYNPPYVDILWMINDRSPMTRNQEKLFSELKSFFARLDSIPDQYRMAVVTHDMEISQGQLQPRGNPIILEKKLGVGTPELRANAFSDLLSRAINLRTGATDRGLESTWVALNRYFKPRTNVPLVLVLVSDSDDRSVLPSGETDTVDFYRRAFLSLKANRPELLRVYSVNYLKDVVPSDSTRCATRYNADVDSAQFQDIYFRLARQLGGSQREGVTADLCGSFASQIDLSGLALRDLPKRFLLDVKPRVDSIAVSVSVNGSRVEAPWSYDQATNEIVFETAPPEGATINVTFHL